MAIREILKYPQRLLKKRSREVDRIDGELKKLIQDMTETMYDAGGVGLAAPQVGISRRVIVVDVSPIDPQQTFFVMINPEIVSEEGDIDHEEMSERPRLSGKGEEKRKSSSPGNLSGGKESGNFRRGDIGLRPSTRNRSSQWGPHSGQGQSIEEGCLP